MNDVAPSSTIDDASLRALSSAFAANAGRVDREGVLIIENAIRTVELAASLAGNHTHAKANAIERDLRSGPVQTPWADTSFFAAGRGVLH
jgi:hypothetical protein